MEKIGTKHTNTVHRKNGIIKAALGCFICQGVDKVSIHDIYRESGASIGSLYHHFRSREKLAEAVYIEGIRNYQKGFLAGFEANQDLRSGIFAVVAYY